MAFNYLSMSFLTIKAPQTPRNVILCFSKLKIDFDVRYNYDGRFQ